jgi:hypothetical protein
MMTFNNIRIKTWTPWTPWTPFHSVNKYFKNDVHEEHLQFKKDFIQKIYFFYWSKGVSRVSTLSGMIRDGRRKMKFEPDRD